MLAPNKNLLKTQISVQNVNKPRDKAIGMINVFFLSLQSFKIKSDGFHIFLAKKEIQIDGFTNRRHVIPQENSIIVILTFTVIRITTTQCQHYDHHRRCLLMKINKEIVLQHISCYMSLLRWLSPVWCSRVETTLWQ